MWKATCVFSCDETGRTMAAHVTILVTGFEPFGEIRVNPSALIVEHLMRAAPRGVQCEVLRTEFVAAEERIRQLIREHRPETVICVGVAPSAAEVRLERLAANVDNARMPDNAGYQPTESAIVPDGRPTLSVTLPLNRMLAAVLELGIPGVVSDDAGRFVCNHVLYAALDEIAQLGLPTKCGFIHVPLCRGMGNADDAGTQSALGLADLIAAVESCIAQSGAPQLLDGAVLN